MNDVIINKVAESGILTLDLVSFLPKEEIKEFDLKEYLFKGLILKEKEFRLALQETDWQPFRDHYVTVTCSSDAIIPAWAYMLVTVYLQPLAKEVLFGNLEEATKLLCTRNIDAIDPVEFKDQRIVIKGCGDIEIGAYAFLEITKKLLPFARSIMYGEPCSTVPVFKKKLEK